MLDRRVFKVVLCLIPILAITLFPLRLGGQETGAKYRGEKAEPEPQTVTGCLQKGEEPGGFVLTADDGQVWELTSPKVKLADHVGHKVKLSGSRIYESEEHEKKMEASEKKEAGSKEYADLKVSSLEMVSDSCK